MTFQFASLAEFLNMGGHGVYVWFCYIVTAASFSYLALAPWLRKRQFFRIQKAIFSRQHS